MTENDSFYIIKNLEFCLDGSKIILFKLFLLIWSMLRIFEFHLLPTSLLIKLQSFEFEDSKITFGLRFNFSNSG